MLAAVPDGEVQIGVIVSDIRIGNLTSMLIGFATKKDWKSSKFKRDETGGLNKPNGPCRTARKDPGTVWQLEPYWVSSEGRSER
jgi:hypothetical protein